MATQGNIISIFDEGAVSEGEQLYFDMIDRAAKAPEDRLISNAKPKHAAYLIYKFFETARRNLRMFSRELPEHFDGVWAFGDEAICSAAIWFLRRNRKNRLSIILEESVNPADHRLLIALADARLSQQVKLAQLEEELELDCHFLLRDKSAFRVEIGGNNPKVLVNFHDEKLGWRLKEVFKSMAKSARRVEI